MEEQYILLLFFKRREFFVQTSVFFSLRSA